MRNTFLVTCIVAIMFSGCSKLSVDEKNRARAEIDLMANSTIAKLIEKEPSIQKDLDRAVGYGVVNWKVTKIPVVGAGGGNGVIVDNRTNERVYINVRRFDLGGGWGARSFKNLIIVYDKKILDEAKDGDFRFEAGAEVSAGSAASDGGSAKINKKIETHVLADGGGSATATIRFLRSSVSSDLN